RVSHGPTLCRGRAGTRVDGGGVREPGALGYRGGPVGRRGGAVPGSRVPLRRVLVHGVTGSGKTTLARRIADVTGLPWHSVDDEIGWLPGWVSRPEVEQRAIAARIAAGDAWVLDTTYSAWRDVVLPRVELVVALDYPRWLSFGRLLRRTVRRMVRREEICNGNVESLRVA